MRGQGNDEMWRRKKMICKRAVLFSICRFLWSTWHIFM